MCHVAKTSAFGLWRKGLCLFNEVSKGGITSNDVLSTGLKHKQSRVLGQILTGCSVVRCPAEHDSFPDLPVVIFPGNVGDETALAQAYTILSAEQTSKPIRHSA
jgi:uncharacterized protein YgbK (DUF1537 family)